MLAPAARDADAVRKKLGPAREGIRSDHSGRLASVADGSKAEGAVVIQFENGGGADQRWKLIPADDDFFLIRNPHSGLYLSKPPRDDRVVEIGKRHDGDAVRNQHWRPIPVPGEAGWCLVQNRASGKFLSIDNGSRDDAAHVIQYKLNGPAGTADQWWQFDK